MTVPLCSDRKVISHDPYIQNEVNKLRVALEYYADGSKYFRWSPELDRDRGAVARAALENKAEINE